MENLEFVRRDISWLSFNSRVLQEASDKNVPLFERIKFLAIYSSNLDEFFRVRVAALRNLKQLKKEARKEFEIKPKKELKEIRKIVQKQQMEFGKIFRGQILPQLQKEGIFLIQDFQKDLSNEHKEFVKKYFQDKVTPHLNTFELNLETEMPFLENKSLYFVVDYGMDNQACIVNIPSNDLPRFLELPKEENRHVVVFLDDIIRFNLEAFLGQPFINAYSIKVSRDAEMHIDDEYEFPDDLVSKIKDALTERNLGTPTRFLYDDNMPEALLELLKKKLHLKKDEMIPGARYHNFNDFFSFPDPTDNEALHDLPMPPLPHPVLEKAESYFQLLQSMDVMLHFPYQKYDYVAKFILEAANDPDTREIKITLYRVAAKSAVVLALLEALKKGKRVIAFIEAKARFDEASNLFWGEELEKAGAKVMYSIPGIKVHTKLLLINRAEAGKIHYYSYLATGNFNEKTAKLYADHGLFTADNRLGKEVSQVFDLLERKIIIPRTKHLLVSPFSTRNGFIQMIDREIKNAQMGKEAYMILKMNSLEDLEMVNKLYEASQAGVKIQMIIRGICCLIPGVKGLSENISAISIVGRFLEHARVYIFANGGNEEMYIASADWMKRNLDHRVEVVIPVFYPEIYQELKTIVNIQLNDNIKARIINNVQSNPYRSGTLKTPKVEAQTAIYQLLKEKSGMADLL